MEGIAKCGSHLNCKVEMVRMWCFGIQWNVTNLICRTYGKVNLKAHEKSNCATEILP